MPSVRWLCWLGVRKSIRPVKIKWWGVGVVICLERGADDLHVVHLMPLPSQNLSPHLNPDWFYLSGTSLPRLSLEKRLLNRCSSTSFIIISGLLITINRLLYVNSSEWPLRHMLPLVNNVEYIDCRQCWSFPSMSSKMPVYVVDRSPQLMHNSLGLLESTMQAPSWDSFSRFCRSHQWPIFISVLQSVLWRCSLGGRKGIRPVKNWVVGCWRGYLSGARCRLAYGPADATATHCLLLQ